MKNFMRKRYRRLAISFCFLAIYLLSGLFFPGVTGVNPVAAADEESGLPSRARLHRFSKGRVHSGFGGGAGLGLTVLGSLLSHDLIFGYAGAGEVLSETFGEGRWYAGNFELWGELFGGFQYDPKTDYFAGLTPFIRYNLIANRHVVPFIEIGAGVSLTDIEGVDLEGKFQFNLQGGLGIHYFFEKEKSIVLQSRFFHFSNGGLAESNRGLNAVNFYFGYSWFH